MKCLEIKIADSVVVLEEEECSLKRHEGTKINLDRTKEAIDTGAKTVASACPFCMTMLTDGVKDFEKNEDVAVKDIAEIILENTL